MKKNLLSFIAIFLFGSIFVFGQTNLEIPIISTGQSEWFYLEDENDVVYDSVLVELSHDDAEQENEEMDALNDDDIDFGWEGAPEDQNVLSAGLRFQNVQIPQGSTIDAAYLIVTSHEAKSTDDVAATYAMRLLFVTNIFLDDRLLRRKVRKMKLFLKIIILSFETKNTSFSDTDIPKLVRGLSLEIMELHINL